MSGLGSPAQLLAELERKQGPAAGESPLQARRGGNTPRSLRLSCLCPHYACHYDCTDLHALPQDLMQRVQSGAAPPAPAADRLEVFPEPG